MEYGTPICVARFREARPHMAGYVGRTGVIHDPGHSQLLPGYVAVALNHRDGTPPTSRPILIIFHQDELTVLDPTTVRK